MKVLVTGAGGMLAHAVLAELEAGGHDVVARPRQALDVTDARAVERAVQEAAPDAVVQCAAYTRVDDAEEETEEAVVVNGAGTAHVARACRAVGARLVYPSTDYVFDGTASAPYPPDSPPSPINAYGRSKRAGEEAAAQAEEFLVVRTAWLYGAGGGNFVRTILERARSGEPLRVVDDQRGSPTWTRVVARVFRSLLENDAPAGVYHATCRGETTWYGLALAVLALTGEQTEIEPVPTEALPRPAARPRYSVLDCSATESVVGPLPPWREALADALEEGV